MTSRLVVLFSLFFLAASCSKDGLNTTISEEKYICGEIAYIAMGTSAETGFSIELESPTEETYFAIVSDTALAQLFSVGKDILLKGNRTDSYLDVEKIISIDNDVFNLQGAVASMESNESGYSATIVGSDEESYDVLFSMSNLGAQYHEYTLGDTANISGDLWLLDNHLKVTAKSIQ